MAIEIFNEIKTGGFVILPYDLLQCLEADDLVVLWQIIAELNNAEKNNLNLFNDILCDTERMAKYLGIDIEYLNSILENLQEQKFIVCFDSHIENTIYIRVNTDEIINFKKTANAKKGFINWDDGLNISQNPLHKKNCFNQSTLNIKKFIESHIKNIETVPLVAYSYLHDCIKSYENKYGEITSSINNLDKYLLDMVSKPDFNRYDVMDLSDAISRLSEKDDKN